MSCTAVTWAPDGRSATAAIVQPERTAVVLMHTAIPDTTVVATATAAGGRAVAGDIVLPRRRVATDHAFAVDTGAGGGGRTIRWSFSRAVEPAARVATATIVAVELDPLMTVADTKAVTAANRAVSDHYTGLAAAMTTAETEAADAPPPRVRGRHVPPALSAAEVTTRISGDLAVWAAVNRGDMGADPVVGPVHDGDHTVEMHVDERGRPFNGSPDTLTASGGAVTVDPFATAKLPSVTTGYIHPRDGTWQQRAPDSPAMMVTCCGVDTVVVDAKAWQSDRQLAAVALFSFESEEAAAAAADNLPPAFASYALTLREGSRATVAVPAALPTATAAARVHEMFTVNGAGGSPRVRVGDVDGVKTGCVVGVFAVVDGAVVIANPRGWIQFMRDAGVGDVVQMVTYRSVAGGTLAEGTVPPVVGPGAPFRPPGVPGVGWFDEETFGRKAVENAFNMVMATGRLPLVVGIFIAGRGRPNRGTKSKKAMGKWKGWAHRIDVYKRRSGGVVIGPLVEKKQDGALTWMGSLRLRKSHK